MGFLKNPQNYILFEFMFIGVHASSTNDRLIEINEVFNTSETIQDYPS